MGALARGERGSKTSQAMLVLAAAGAILGASLMINHQHSMRHAVHVRELQESLSQQLEFVRPSVLALKQLEAVGGNPMDKDSDQATILVSVVAFRDPECHRTIKDLFQRAQNPQRIFVALVDQLDPSFPHEECSVQKRWPWADHVRTMRFSSDLSRGSVVSRYFSSMLYRDEDFWFQIDAHCLFEPRWDAKLVDMWKERVTLLADAGMGDRVILSHYPLAYNGSSLQVSEMAELHTTAQCSGVFSEHGIFTPRARAIKKEKAQQLQLQPVPAIAGGMVFGVGRLILDVPFDPWLLHIFSGDELDYSLRAYSKGYRVFNPTDNIVYHHYGRPDQPRTWATHADQGYAVMSQTSEDRVKAALRVEPITANTEAVVKMQLDVYGISVESRREWEREFGINLTTRTIAHDWC